MQVQPSSDAGDLWEAGGSLEGRQAGRPIDDPHIPGHRVGHGADGDPPARRETGHTEAVDQGLAGQAGMQETGVAVPNWEVVSCLQGGASGAYFPEKDD